MSRISQKLNENALRYNTLGNEFRSTFQFEEARSAYQKALEIQPDFAIAHCNLGIIFTALLDNDHAVFHLKKALELNSDLLPAFNQLGDIYLRLEKYVEARDIFLKSIEKMPANIESNHRLGIAYFKLRDFENAKTQFEKVITMDHKHSEVNQYLANTVLEMGDHELAMQYYFRQLEINPWFETFYNLGVLYMIKERLKEALMYFDRAIALHPDDLPTLLNVAYIYLKRNQREQAILYYEKINQLKPHDPEIQHIITALKQDETPDNSPAEYITHLFDQYATHYDTHLTKALKYEVPQKILKTIQLEYPYFSDKKWRILDLGCGTGLCGTLFKPYATQLIGIDLSENMLAIAAQKNIYDELVAEDIAHALTRFSDIELIVAADVFTYIGDLVFIFERISKALSKDGLFIFTVEKTHQKNFVLQTSIRYAHSKDYLTSLLSTLPLDIVRFDNIEMRQQQGEPVEGYLVLVRKR